MIRLLLCVLILLFSGRIVNADIFGEGIVIIEEEDGSPSVAPYKLKVANATLTDNGDGSASLAGGSASVSDTVYGAGWNGSTTVAPSQNVVWDKIETLFSSTSIDTSAELAAILTDETGTGLAVFNTNPVLSGLVDNQTNDAATATVSELYRLTHTSTGTVAADFGAGIDTYLEDASGNAAQQASRIATIWTDPTEASEDSAITFSGVSAGGALTEWGRFIPGGTTLGGTAGVSATAAAGVLTLSGVGGTNNESIKFDFETNANIPVVTSNTGITRISWSGFNMGIIDDFYFQLGTAGGKAQLGLETTGNDNVQFGIVVGSTTGSGYLSIMELADLGDADRSPLATIANPVLRIYSADATSATDYGELYQDGTNFNIGVGEGVVVITGGGLTSTAGTTTLGTVAGAVDAGGATSFEFPNGANPTTSVPGQVTIDTSAGAGQGINYTGADNIRDPGWKILTIAITSATSASDSAVIHIPYAITIRQIRVLCVGGTNWVGQVTEFDANGANGANVDSADITATAGTTASDDGTLSNPSIDATDMLGVTTTSVSGTNTRVLITVAYTVDQVN